MAVTVTNTRRFLRLPAVMEKTGLSRASIYRLGALGRFPKRVKISENTAAWDEQEIDAFLNERVAATRDDLESSGRTGT
ncbi:MAG: AlpA family transcriptional regulator [Proteobacteria bacterium]|nr:AlpA family transcriptional regulator [Pseudomonadota bacterium]